MRFSDPVAPYSGDVGPAEPGDAGADRADDVQAAGGAVRLLQDGHRRVGGRPDAAERDRHVRHPQAAQGLAESRSEERRVGKEWASTCRSRGSQYNKKKNKKSKN